MFLILTFLIGLFACSTVTAVDSIDGALLAAELRKVKEGIGVNYLQEQFNSFPYETKSDTGNQLLQRIQSSLDVSLTQLNKVLTDVKDKIVSVNTDTDSSSLPRCCDISEDQLTYIPKFQTKVDVRSACVTTSPIVMDNLKYPTDQISATMKNNYDLNKNVLWQHYSTTEGVSVIYPATYWENCQNFDPRYTSSYASAASPTNKDVVLVIDTSSSMKQPSGITAKTKMVIVKEAANNVIQTLKPNDRVGLVSFDKEAKTPSMPSTSHSCYENDLAFATKENTDELKQHIFTLNTGTTGDSNYEKALLAAFNYFHSSNDTLDNDNRVKVILFITDGKSTLGRDPVLVISEENAKLQNKISIFTYLIGQDQDAQIQLTKMANQDLSIGPKSVGHFEDFNQNNQKLLSTKLATFYMHLPTSSQSDQSTFTVPYVDRFSKVGLITSLCRPVNVISFHGVMCTDVKISELLTEVEYFSEDEYSYAFMIDGLGRVLMHPLLPNAAFVKSTEDPVLVDIGVLEREVDAQSVIESMKSGGMGKKTLTKFFTKPRGKLVNDGSRDDSLTAYFYWGSIPQSNLSLCVVLVDESYSEIDESQFQLSDVDLQNVFMYHNRSLLKDSFSDCKFYSRRVTSDRSSVKFSQSAFQNPFQYLDRDETAEDVTNYGNYLTRQKLTNPGFKSTLRSAVWATYEAEQYWKSHPARFVSWRYIGTKAGMIRIYPGVSLQKPYDHEKRAWWRQAMAHPNKMFLTTPYVDSWGSGIVLSLVHTIYKKGSTTVTAAVGADFPLEYFNWLFSSVYPTCNDVSYWCIIVDDSGFIVMHPRLKETTIESGFKEPKHITIEEPGIAKILKREGVLNSKECQDFSKNTNLRSFRMTMPVNKLGGLDFKDTDEAFEIRPIAETNVFIIRRQTIPSTDCKCDSTSPDIVECNNQCECLCHSPIIYDVCSNKYNTGSASPPCSARLPDTSGVSQPDDTQGLSTCYVPKCHQKATKTDCFSELECSWCEYNDLLQQIATPCCRLKEECTFGKTKSQYRNTCAAAPSTTTDKTSDEIDAGQIGGIIGGSIAFGILLTLIMICGIKFFRTRNRNENADPYIEAIPDYELRQYREKEECSSTDSPPPPYQIQPAINHNFYVDSSPGHKV
ncbi:VWFA and cache domain-containing protein 1-like isoform X1 [Mytilus galloprovincialis]|uniref:VWFA and cache domain-containing protein 1-like isoform X1 n=1 Tax=Mytilus galloprovincialis TaxID=29158 RepID=UPI003F7B6371